MSAHKFVAEKGIEEAKRVLKGAPSEATHFEFIKTAFIKTAIYMQFCGGEWFWLNTNCNEWLLDYPNGITERQCLKELKQVVDSIDYLNEWYEGKIDGAYDHVERMHGMLKLKPQFPNLHSRIKLVERHLANYELVQANKNGEA